MTIKQQCSIAHHVGRLAGFLQGVLFTFPLLLFYVTYAFRLANGWHDEILIVITLIWAVVMLNSRIKIKIDRYCNKFARRVYSNNTTSTED